MHTNLRWKGKLVSKSVYDRNLRFSAVRKNRTSVDIEKPNLQSSLGVTVVEESTVESPDVAKSSVDLSGDKAAVENWDDEIIPVANEDSSEDENLIEGRRIVELGWMAKRMICQSCRGDLLLRNIEHERRSGFASLLHIRCESCLLVNKIPTGKQHVPDGCHQPLYDTNTKVVLGALHTGLGHSHLNKLMRTINVPTMSSTMFKRREREIGPIIETVAVESCKKAAAQERDLTIKNADELNQILPQNLQTGFLFPATIDRRSSSEHRPPDAAFVDADTNETSVDSPVIHEVMNTRSKKDEAKSAVSPDDVVRTFASYDMGWSKRGTGRAYDSLNGYSAIIGTQSGKVMDFATRNRKCRLCDLCHAKEDHDCRFNFCGTAKAMEADAAVQLTTASTVLKGLNVEVGVFVGDNDSASICSIRKASTHQIVKLSDMNHTAKGVTSMLYKIDKSKDPCRELTPEAIKYLQRCFVYAAAQHKGDSAAMAVAIRNIPYHAFNQHDNCGEWCGYSADKENYTHNTISGGFKDPTLFEELKTKFGQLAENTDKFAAGASSQANESLNAGMSKKAPKSICYSMSESADFRFAAAVCQKNEGEGYVQDVLQTHGLSPGKHLSTHVANCKKICKRKSTLAKTKQFKLHMSGDVLQIAMKSSSVTFDRYINPSQSISPKASEVHGLTNEHGDLYLRGERVPSLPLRAVLGELLQFLQAFPKPCTLVAHNCSFDAPRLLKIIEDVSLVQEFKCAIAGFTDTLKLFREKFPTAKSKGECTLTSLAAKTLSLPSDGAHDACYDVFLLEKLALFHFSTDDLIARSQSFEEVLEAQQRAAKSKTIFATLQPLEKIVSRAMRVKLSNAGIIYDTLVTTYRTKGAEETTLLLWQEENGKAQVIKTKKILVSILEYLKSL